MLWITARRHRMPRKFSGFAMGSGKGLEVMDTNPLIIQ
jgi:hypothetical protein